MTVGPELLDCVGVGPRKCLEVGGELSYGRIDEFKHEEGHTYRLKIEPIRRISGKRKSPLRTPLGTAID